MVTFEQLAKTPEVIPGSFYVYFTCFDNKHLVRTQIKVCAYEANIINKKKQYHIQIRSCCDASP